MNSIGQTSYTEFLSSQPPKIIYPPHKPYTPSPLDLHWGPGVEEFKSQDSSNISPFADTSVSEELPNMDDPLVITCQRTSNFADPFFQTKQSPQSSFYYRKNQFEQGSITVSNSQEARSSLHEFENIVLIDNKSSKNKSPFSPKDIDWQDNQELLNEIKQLETDQKWWLTNKEWENLSKKYQKPVKIMKRAYKRLKRLNHSKDHQKTLSNDFNYQPYNRNR